MNALRKYLIQWQALRTIRRAQSALARDVERRKRENALYLKRREAGKLGWTRRALVGGRS